MQLKFSDGKIAPLKEAIIRLRLGSYPGYNVLGVNSFTQEQLQPASRLSWSVGGVDIGPLQPIHHRDDRLVLTTIGPALPIPPTQLQLIQRGEQEKVLEAARRLNLAHCWQQPNGLDAPMEGSASYEDGAWPRGACLMLPVGESPCATEQRLIGWLGERLPTLAGVAAEMLNDASRQDRWRFRFHLPNEKSENLVLPLAGSWSLDAREGPEDGCILKQSLGQLIDADLNLLMGQLLDTQGRNIALPRGASFPKRPISVRLANGGATAFCREIEIKIANENNQWNCTVRLMLVDDPRAQRPAHAPLPPRILLAECAQVPAKQNERLFGLKPPAAGALKNLEAELTEAANWSMKPADALLKAARVVPGFVRENEVALYTRLRVGDLVLVQIVDGALPVIVGALHERRNQWEEGDSSADIACAATQIDFGPSAAQSDGARLRLAGGKARLVAPSDAEVKSPRVEIQGQMEVAKAAAFKGEVTVG
ncbi:hypothetical protein [Pedosphaera parvula]|uniref:Uncharacterized protein n=1 Tax=Pedosphaera parvula (strain Ellin514) TaxID=320771 RepID=B9XAG0_PEDPL|nr:hypothetical protein [Pedosphaera parvula]EEF62995.1 hypothetical protein Cflav_PD5630 [Pedosphaera parvula Ellin514]